MDFDDPFSKPTGPRLDAQFVNTMLQAVQTGVSLIRLQHELGHRVAEEDVQSLVHLQRSAILKLQNEQSRRRKKAKNIEEQRRQLKALEEIDVPEDDDDEEIDVPF